MLRTSFGAEVVESGEARDQTWPLLVYLHGIGERGDTLEEIEVVKELGPPKKVEQDPKFPFLVLSPQCPSGRFWGSIADKLEQLLDEIVHLYDVDPDRIYLTGFSMGGNGLWQLVLKDPTRFAALVPVAGFYNINCDRVPENICDLSNIPTWVFHSEKDEALSAMQSEVMVQAIEDCGGHPIFTLYDDAGHVDTARRAYENPVLYEWLLEQNLP